MKKVLVAALAACFLVFLLAGCSSSASSAASSASTSSPASSAAAGSSDAGSLTTNAETGIEVRVASLKGPTSIGLAKFINEAAEGNLANNYDFAISGTADEVLPNLIQGKVDIALIPANAAATVYAKTNGAISALDVNTLGVLYVVSGDETLANLTDLAGKSIYMTGKGTTPEYVMNYLLSQAGIADSVTLEFKSEATEVAAALNADENAIGVLPEPYVTSVTLQNDRLSPRISLTEAWDALQGEDGSQLVTGVTVVRNDFLEAHPTVVSEFLGAQQESVAFAVANPAEAGQLVVQAGIMDNAQAAAAAIPRCNLVCLTGASMKDALAGYLGVLFEQDPSSVGGAVPDEGFYYSA